MLLKLEITYELSSYIYSNAKIFFRWIIMDSFTIFLWTKCLKSNPFLSYGEFLSTRKYFIYIFFIKWVNIKAGITTKLIKCTNMGNIAKVRLKICVFFTFLSHFGPQNPYQLSFMFGKKKYIFFKIRPWLICKLIVQYFCCCFYNVKETTITKKYILDEKNVNFY